MVKIKIFVFGIKENTTSYIDLPSYVVCATSEDEAIIFLLNKLKSDDVNFKDITHKIINTIELNQIENGFFIL